MISEQLYDAMAADVHELHIKLAAAEAALKKAQAEQDASVIAEGELLSRLDAAEAALAESKVECIDLAAKLDTSADMAARYIVAKAELERDLAAMTAYRDELEHACMEANAYAERDLAVMTQERDRWRELVAERTAERDDLQEQLSDAEFRVGANLNTGRRFQAECYALSTQLKAARARAERLAEALQDIIIAGKPDPSAIAIIEIARAALAETASGKAVVHSPSCIGGDRGPCNCGAKQD